MTAVAVVTNRHRLHCNGIPPKLDEDRDSANDDEDNNEATKTTIMTLTRPEKDAQKQCETLGKMIRNEPKMLQKQTKKVPKQLES